MHGINCIRFEAEAQKMANKNDKKIKKCIPREGSLLV